MEDALIWKPDIGGNCTSNKVNGIYFLLSPNGNTGKYYAYKFPIGLNLGEFDEINSAIEKCQSIIDKYVSSKIVKLATDKPENQPLIAILFPTDDWDAFNTHNRDETIEFALERLHEGHSFVAVQYNSEDDVEGITQEIVNDCAGSFLDGFEGEPLDAPDWAHETDAWSDYRDQWDSDEQYGTEQEQVAKLYRSAV